MDGDVLVSPGDDLRCFICDGPGTGMQKLSKVTRKGHPKMVSYSEYVDDAAIIRRLNDDWKNGDDPKLRYHMDCRTELYNRVKSISTATATANRQDEEDRNSDRVLSLSGPGTSSVGIPESHSSSVHLVYREVCILCNEAIDVGSLTRHPDRARKLYRIPDIRHMNRLKTNLMDTAVGRGDAWGNEVAGRLSGISDLVAEEALYHLRCRTMFENQAIYAKVGRPLDKEKQLLFDNLCKWMDEEVEHGVTTLAEIHTKMIELDPTENKSMAYSRRYLKTKLQQEYNESLYFTSEGKREDIVCLKDTTNAILRDYRQWITTSGHTLDDAELKQNTITTAINLICGDLARVPLTRKQYPSVDSMTNIESQLALIPDSIQQLLKPIVKTDEKVALWGQNMIKAYRPRSAVMPSQLGLTIQLDHKFGSKWLIERCHRLGYCESYDELHRYRYCYLSEKNGLGSMDQDTVITDKDGAGDEDIENAEVDAVLSLADNQEKSDDENEMDEDPQTSASFDPDEVTVHQFVGDNIDLNIVSLNGNTAFHAMGMIKVTCPAPVTRQNELLANIPRTNVTIEEKAANLKAAEVKMIPFVPRKKVGLADVQFVPVADLHQDTPTLQPGDIAWAAGWALKNHNPAFDHHNWNGFMKSIHQPECKEKSLIEFHPIIEGDPNDYSTIYTTLMECLRSGHSPAVITFDLPIWLKATQIVLQSQLPIITRLGGFHLLKSFLGSIGSIMADSGLQELVQLVYPGRSTVEHILSGGAYAKSIRFHLLASVAITKFVLRDVVFSEQEFKDMEDFIKNAKNEKTGTTHGARIVTVFKERMDETLKTLAAGGRTPALWVWYHGRIDLIKVFIRCERIPDHSGHLSCIIAMLNTFAAAGHHQYAKGARLYVQLMQQRHESPVFQDF